MFTGHEQGGPTTTNMTQHKNTNTIITNDILIPLKQERQRIKTFNTTRQNVEGTKSPNQSLSSEHSLEVFFSSMMFMMFIYLYLTDRLTCDKSVKSDRSSAPCSDAEVGGRGLTGQTGRFLVLDVSLQLRLKSPQGAWTPRVARRQVTGGLTVWDLVCPSAPWKLFISCQNVSAPPSPWSIPVHRSHLAILKQK